MGPAVDPAELTESGERCLLRLTELPRLQLPTEQLITVIGTVVEGHVSRILARLIVLSKIDESPFGNALLQSQVDSMDNTWPDRNHWLTRGFELAYPGLSPYQSFDVLVQARNAIVHGDGALTDRQTRKIKDLLILRKDFQKKLDATVRGRLQFGDTSAKRAMEIARGFVVAFDKEVILKHPGARIL